MDIAEKIIQKKKEAKHYSAKFNNNNSFFVLASYKSAVLTNSIVAVEELKHGGYNVVFTFVNGKEV